MKLDRKELAELDAATIARQRLAELASWLEQGAPQRNGHTFNMETFCMETSCGTAACIAGTAIRWWGDSGLGMILSQAQELLGLSYDDARRMFFARGADVNAMRVVDWRRITPQMAGAVIRHYLDTGVVDWKRYESLARPA